jgi:hypothetical protein
MSNYYSNFEFTEDNIPPNGDLTKLSEDSCYIQQKQMDNDVKLKYMTTNFNDLMDSKFTGNIFNINYSDSLFVPSEQIDLSSSLRQGGYMSDSLGGQLTNVRLKTSLGQLPLPTLPSKYQSSHNINEIDLEDNLRFQDYTNSLKKNTCVPRDNTFHDRFFTIFSDDIPLPNPLNSVENFQRAGIPSRNLNRQLQ